MQRLCSLSDRDPTLCCELAHEKETAASTVTEKQAHYLRENVLFILPLLCHARYFLDVLQKCLLIGAGMLFRTSLLGFSLYYLKQILLTEANT